SGPRSQPWTPGHPRRRPTRRPSDLGEADQAGRRGRVVRLTGHSVEARDRGDEDDAALLRPDHPGDGAKKGRIVLISSVSGLYGRSEEHTSELQSRFELVCRLPLAKK